MNEVFISYSRKDKTFVKKLDTALRAVERDPWVDWEDIPLTADWWSEIQAGIEGADTFVFVISPDSAASEVCGQELDHATLHNKRIVPIVYRDTDNPPSKVTHLNWIFCRETDHFESAFESLLETMETDLDWVKAHTRLTQRAVEWDKKSRNDSLLLRGDDLADAENLLPQTDKTPILTDLQKQYIIASRQSAIHRKQITLAGLGVGLILTILLIIAFWQFLVANEQRAIANEQREIAEQERQEAERLKEIAEQERELADEARQEAEQQKERAEQGEKLATSRGLSAQSQLHLEVDPELSMLLALQAISTTHTQQAQSLLQQAVHVSHIERTLPLARADVAAIAFNPRERLAAVANLDASISLVEIQTGQEIMSLTDHDDIVTILTFSEDNHRLASASRDGSVIVWDTQNGEALLTIVSDYGLVSSLDLNKNGDLVAIGYEDGSLEIWSVAAGQSQIELTGSEGAITALAFSQNDRQLASADNKNFDITIWDIATGEEEVVLSGHAGPVTALTFHTGARLLLASASEDKTATVWDITSEELQFQIFVGHDDALQSVAIDQRGTLLVTGSRDNTAKVWNIESGEVNLTLTGHTDVVNATHFAPEGVIVTASTDGTVRFWRMTSPYVNTGYRDWVTGIDWHPAGHVLGAVDANGLAYLWRIDNPSASFTLRPHEEAANQIAFSPQGDRLATASGDTTVAIWPLEADNDDLTFIHPAGDVQTLSGHDDWVTSVAWRPDGKILASGGIDNLIILWDTTTLAQIQSIETPGWVSSLAWHPNGDILAAGLDNGSIELIDSQGQPIMTLTGHTDWVNSVDFSPDGLLLASASDDETINIWDVQSGELLRALTEHTDPVYDAEFSPDGKLLASGGQDKTAIIWNVVSGEVVLKFLGHNNAIQSVAFHPDGKQLATGSRDRSVRLFILDLDELQKTAINRLSRWWSPKECQQFLPDQTCPPEPENLKKPPK
jgi:WD40 repeat protein